MFDELSPADAAVLVVDYQDRLCAAMPPSVVETHARNVGHLLILAQRLRLPVIATEQYPRGLGSIIPSLKEHLPDSAYEKIEFSALRAPSARAAIAETGRSQWIVAGMETHICVYQTVRDLLALGHSVWVVADGVVSRTRANWRAGLDLCAGLGAVITVTEAVLFELLKEGRGDTFKAVSKLIR